MPLFRHMCNLGYRQRFSMADSDDEYDRKRRDKFRGERSSGDTGYRSERRDERRGGLAGGREDWPERNPFRGGGGGGGGGGRPRPDYRDFRSARDRYGSPGRELPSAKRMRPDWGDDLRPSPRFGYDPYLMHAWNEHYASHSLHGPSLYGHQPHGSHLRDSLPLNPDLQTQPAMLTLKQFLDTQDDSISDSEVLRKYSEYKLEYKRQQLNEFFVAHKDEEWFKNKYHPVDSVKRREEQLSFLKRRVDVFKEVYDKGLMNEVLVDTAQTDQLLRLLDIIVIKLEGGNDEDLKVLDEKPKETSATVEKKIEHDDDVIITAVVKKSQKRVGEEDEDSDSPAVVSPRAIRKAPVSDDENWDDDDDNEPTPIVKIEDNKKAQKKDKKSLKRKRKNSDSSSSSSSETDSSSTTSSEDEDDKNGSKYDLEKMEIDEKKTNEILSPTKSIELNGPSSPMEEINLDENEKQEKMEIENDKQVEAVENNENVKKEVNEIEENGSEKLEQNDKESNNDEKVEDATNVEDNKAAVVVHDEPETIDLDKEKDIIKPRALHRTSSIFLRNLAPAITKAEIETLCKRFDGFLRVAIADPLVERRWYRRGWVTFNRDVNIKEICWNLNNTRLRDCEMGAIVNRDLSRRVRLVNGMTAHKTIVRSDIKLCAKITMNLDDKFKLWETANTENALTNGIDGGNENGNDKQNSYGFVSNNPVLQNITDFLIEEGSAEEEELLGLAGDAKEDNDGIDRDTQLLTVLDKLILYLRVVHSVDFYNHCEYPYEDEMPNRCGIIHARGPPPTKITQTELQDYIKNFENKMQSFLTKATTLENEELQNLGCKDADTEVEKFVQANTQELAKDKWLCPLSGKKFKGPEFIRKHIFNKHGEKVDEVRKEVEYFNNYLKDPKRPQLPEHPGNATKRNNSESSGGYRPSGFGPAFGPPYTAYAPPLMMPGGRGGRGFGGGGGSRRQPNEYRQLIQYRDLDAPHDSIDIFN